MNQLQIFFTVLLCAMSTSCATGVGTGVRDAASARISEAYDESLHNAQLWVCKGASVGSVIRRYGGSEAEWEAWKRLCKYSGGEISKPIPNDQ